MFVSAIIGGLGSVTGVIMGALYSRITLRLPTLEWRLLATSIGVLLILLVLPGGLGSQVIKLRDLVAKAAHKYHDRQAQVPAAAAPVAPAPIAVTTDATTTETATDEAVPA